MAKEATAHPDQRQDSLDGSAGRGSQVGRVMSECLFDHALPSPRVIAGSPRMLADVLIPVVGGFALGHGQRLHLHRILECSHQSALNPDSSKNALRRDTFVVAKGAVLRWRISIVLGGLSRRHPVAVGARGTGV